VRHARRAGDALDAARELLAEVQRLRAQLAPPRA